MKPQKILAYLAAASCFGVAIVLSLKSLREPDLWWIMLTGEWILDNGRVVDQDVFSYTMAGTPWINVKWLFEVLAYGMSRIGGPESVFLLQTAANVLVVYFLIRFTRITRLDFGLARSKIPSAGAILAILFALFAWEYRIIGRPEMTSHLMTVLFLVIYQRQRQTPSRAIFWIIPLQVLWTNLHEAYGTGMVIMVVMAGGAVIDYWLQRKREDAPAFPKNTLIASVAGILAISLNPRGPQMILHPFEIFSQVQDNKFTTELNGFDTNYFWQQKEPYLAGFALLLVLIMIFLPFRSTSVVKGKKKRTTKTKLQFRPLQRLGAGYVGMLVLFAYLGLGAHRNLVFFVLAATPIVAVAIDLALQKLSGVKQLSPLRMAGWALLVVIGWGFYGAVGSGKFYEEFHPRDRYGLKVEGVKNPVGAANFLRENNITGKGFSDFLVSSYLMWELRPEFKSYIDFRDLDVFPKEFFEQFNVATQVPEVFEAARDSFNFDYVVLFRPEFATLHKYLYDSPAWEMVHADPVSVIYVERNDKYESLIASINPDAVFQPASLPPPSGFAKGISRLFWPVYDPAAEPPLDHHAIASEYYLAIGDADRARKEAEFAIQSGVDPYAGYASLARVLLQIGDFKVSPQEAPSVYSQAAQAASNGIKADPNRADCYKFLGAAQARLQNLREAERNMNIAIDLNPTDAEAWFFMSIVQNNLLVQNPPNADEVRFKLVDAMARAYALKPQDLFLKYQLGIFRCQQNQCDEARKLLTGLKGYPGISTQELEQLRNCKAQCGIAE